MDFRYTCGSKNKWYKKINKKKFKVLLDLDTYAELLSEKFKSEEEFDKFLDIVVKGDGYIHLPFEFEVCSSCKGRGQYVDPNIDAQGITTEDWEDWSEEDKDNYFNGFYDVTCGECGGEKVVPKINDNYLSSELKLVVKVVKEKINNDCREAREMQKEWEMGY